MLEIVHRLKQEFPVFGSDVECVYNSRRNEFVLAPPFSDGDLDKIEQELGAKLPPTYKRFLGIASRVEFPDAVLAFGRQHPFFPFSGSEGTQISNVASVPIASLLCIADCRLGDRQAQVLLGREEGVYYCIFDGRKSTLREAAQTFGEWLNIRCRQDIALTRDAPTDEDLSLDGAMNFVELAVCSMRSHGLKVDSTTQAAILAAFEDYRAELGSGGSMSVNEWLDKHIGRISQRRLP